MAEKKTKVEKAGDLLAVARDLIACRDSLRSTRDWQRVEHVVRACVRKATMMMEGDTALHEYWDDQPFWEQNDPKKRG